MYAKEKQSFIYFIFTALFELYNDQPAEKSCAANKELCKSTTYGQDN
tara:strand:- start:126 stop:266 length:141 start_codon:yes stop_codon:yes gene_type:complete